MKRPVTINDICEDGGRLMSINRRNFIKKSAVAGVGATAAAGCLGNDGNTNDINWQIEADVIVVGSGAAGLPAAIRARDRNASVIVVEENFDIGGHGIISQGSVGRLVVEQAFRRNMALKILQIKSILKIQDLIIHTLGTMTEKLSVHSLITTLRFLNS